MYRIYANGLTKYYKKKCALDNIDLNIECGNIVGILGKNGSGKTTLNKLISGFVIPSSGTIRVLGKKTHGGENLISFLSENIAIYPELNAVENLKQIYFMDNKKPNMNVIKSTLESISLETGRKTSKNFSLGMKRRLQIAMSVLINPKEIIILDEPTNGLDINGVLWLKSVIKKFKQQNKTVIITSHAISELEELLDNYIILDKGKIIEKGNLNKDIQTLLKLDLLKNDINKTILILDSNNIVYTLKENNLYINIDNAKEATYIINLLDSNNITPMNYQTSKESLVDIFIKCTGEQNV